MMTKMRMSTLQKVFDESRSADKPEYKSWLKTLMVRADRAEREDAERKWREGDPDPPSL